MWSDCGEMVCAVFKPELQAVVLRVGGRIGAAVAVAAVLTHRVRVRVWERVMRAARVGAHERCKLRIHSVPRSDERRRRWRSGLATRSALAITIH